MTLQQILENARTLPAAERLELAMTLWNTIDRNDISLTEAQARELDRRIEEDDADISPARSWTDVKRDLLSGNI
jgi:putative addiction module component (TIGR02574 family)